MTCDDCKISLIHVCPVRLDYLNRQYIHIHESSDFFLIDGLKIEKFFPILFCPYFNHSVSFVSIRVKYCKFMFDDYLESFERYSY